MVAPRLSRDFQERPMSEICDLSGMQLFVMLVFYTISQFGFCWILADSKITRPVRMLIAYFAEHEAAGRPTRVLASFLLALIECVACLGFYVGLGAGYELARAWGMVTLPTMLALGLYTCGINYLLGRATGLLKEE